MAHYTGVESTLRPGAITHEHAGCSADCDCGHTCWDHDRTDGGCYLCICADFGITPSDRYLVRAVDDPSIRTLGLILGQAQTAEAATKIAVAMSCYPYGAAIEDRETGLIDWGHGFGVAIQGAGQEEVR